MIMPITKEDKEYLDWQDSYGVTKFIAKDGEGHRGIIVQNNGKEALIYGLTGNFTKKLFRVKEINPNQWPVEI